MPCYRIPNTTVHLGQAIELVTQRGNEITMWPEVNGYQVLTNPDAMDRERPRVYLVRGDVSRTAPHGRGRGPAVDTWERWHDRHGPEFVGGMYDTPDNINQEIGRAVRLTYRSDKGENPGNEYDYVHEFAGDGGTPPLVYVDNPDEPGAFCLVGGTMEISERGIE